MNALIYFLAVLAFGLLLAPSTIFPLNVMLGSAALGLLVIGIVIFDRRDR